LLIKIRKKPPPACGSDEKTCLEALLAKTCDPDAGSAKPEGPGLRGMFPFSPHPAAFVMSN